MAPINIVGVGQTISRLRKKHNMTQMELADLLGISFQAVSNWERGNSMPDVGKLPELASLFEVSIDELLGQSQPLVRVAAEGNLTAYAAHHEITPAQMAEVAPILKPDQVDEALTHVSFDSLDEIEDLLPFLGQDLLEELAMKTFDAGRSVDGMLPFLSRDALHKLAARALEEDRCMSDYLPFLPQEEVDQIARSYAAKGQFSKASDLCPFLSQEVSMELALELLDLGKDSSEFFPFLSPEGKQTIALKLYEKHHRLSVLSDIAPFLDRKWLTDFVLDKVARGEHGFGELDDIAIFLDREMLGDLIRKAYLNRL